MDKKNTPTGSSVDDLLEGEGVSKKGVEKSGTRPPGASVERTGAENSSGGPSGPGQPVENFFVALKEDEERAPKHDLLPRPEVATSNPAPLGPQNGPSAGGRLGPGVVLILCASVPVARMLEQLIRHGPALAHGFAPDWPALVATGLAVAGIARFRGYSRWLRVRRVMLWSSFLLMVWIANGLPFDLLRLTPLLPLAVDWPGLATKTIACAAAVALLRLVLAEATAATSTRAATWYGYAAFGLALPYPVLRTWWALGGTLGLTRPEAAGHGWIAWLACIPWLLAAALALLLASTRPWLPRRLLLVAGWFATAMVALIGPAACWALITQLWAGGDPGLKGLGVALWVPGLFYSSWLLWAIAAGAATHACQLRSDDKESRGEGGWAQ